MLHKSISEHIPLRTIDHNGKGIEIADGVTRNYTPRPNADFDKAFPSGLSLNNSGEADLQQAKKSGIPVASIRPSLGTNLPIEMTQNFTDYFGARGHRAPFLFLSMDWYGDWLHVLDDEEMNSVSFMHACSALCEYIFYSSATLLFIQ